MMVLVVIMTAVYICIYIEDSEANGNGFIRLRI